MRRRVAAAPAFASRMRRLRAAERWDGGWRGAGGVRPVALEVVALGRRRGSQGRPHDIRGVEVCVRVSDRIALAACAPGLWPLARRQQSQAGLRAAMPAGWMAVGAPRWRRRRRAPRPATQPRSRRGPSRSPGAAPGRSCRRRCCGRRRDGCRVVRTGRRAHVRVGGSRGACASWLFTELRRERVVAPAAASTPTRRHQAAHRSGRGSSIGSSTAACDCPRPRTRAARSRWRFAAWRRATAVKWSRSSASAPSNAA